MRQNRVQGARAGETAGCIMDRFSVQSLRKDAEDAAMLRMASNLFGPSWHGDARWQVINGQNAVCTTPRPRTGRS